MRALNTMPFRYLFILFTALLPTAARANATIEKVETSITSDELTYYAEEQKIIFNKNVKVKRPDFELTSEQLIIYLKQNQQNPSLQTGILPSEVTDSEVQKIVAKKNVRIKQDEHIGACNVATYDEKTGVITLEGSPTLTNGENSVSGEKILYFTREQRSKVIGGNKRVNATFSTDVDQKIKGP